MNFLAHYYFDKKTGEPYYNLGLLLPDLTRNFIKGARLKPESTYLQNPVEKQISLGCLQHIQSDKVFHSWSGFLNLMDLSTEQMRSSGISIKRDWFVSHILVELVIDQWLLRKHPSLAIELYTDFESLDIEVILGFLAHLEINNFESFEKGWKHFMEVRYLESYVKTESILYALDRICTKVGLDPFTDRQKTSLQIVVDVLLNQMSDQIIKLKRELQ
ncbi:MAG: hypothetical protein GC181_14675 [Bacteroidetes bacterium]|nr:hypothetical protein [Bacteroidota bacterium]